MPRTTELSAGDEASSTPRAGGVSRWPPIMLLIVIVLNTAMLLSLRSFPSHDGPMHVYLAVVAGDLLSGGKDYGQYFTLKSLVTPYSFNTYAQIALQRMFDPLLSERLFVCLCVALLLGGFFALARSVSPASGAASLLACPLALHKSVFLGFQNFSAAIGMVLVFCAFWIAHSCCWRWWKTMVFLAMLALLSITHPVGVLVAGLFLGVHTSILAIHYVARSSGPWVGRLRAGARCFRVQLVHLALCLPALFFVTRFAPPASAGTLIFDVVYAVRQLGKFALFGPISAFQTWHYAAPQGVIVIVATSLLWSSLRSRKWNSPEAVSALACLLTAGALTLVYVVSPGEMSRAAHFDQRFPIFALLFFLAASAWNRAPRNWHWIAAGMLCAVSLYVLGYQTVQCRKLNRDLAPVFDMPAARPGSLGALVYEGPIQIYPLSFMPNFYAGAHYFHRSKAILVNLPGWISHPVFMVAPADPVSGPPAVRRPPSARAIRYQNPNFVVPWLLKDGEQHLDVIVSARALSDSGTGQAQSIAQRRGLRPTPRQGACFSFYVAAPAR